MRPLTDSGTEDNALHAHVHYAVCMFVQVTTCTMHRSMHVLVQKRNASLTSLLAAQITTTVGDLRVCAEKGNTLHASGGQATPCIS